VLVNLLNNARRFTEQGNITVRVAPETDRLKVTVADTGIGIPPAELHQVFKEFRQLDGSVSLHQEGSGLGLAISKRFVELHGGRIWAESEGIPGQGSSFHFTLPLQQPPAIEAGPPAPPPPVRTPTGRGRTILLLDQDPFIGQMIEEGLEACRVVSVKAVSEIPELMREIPIRAVILNLAQKSRAWQHLLELREQLGNPPWPVILCPLVSPQYLGEALGVKDYLVKPITRQALLTLLNRLDGDIRRILVIDDDPRMVNLLTRLLEMDSQKYEIIQANNGQAGLAEMQKQSVDLVLMDLSMPELDGYSLLSHMRQNSRLSQIPVAVITAHTGSPEEERQLGGRSLVISYPTGLTNAEVLHYLHHILEAAAETPENLRRTPGALHGGQQVGLSDRLLQIAGRPQ
jgi:DNA-binding response OmpR family regulator